MAPIGGINMIMDITKTGKLVELGCDPFTHAPENKAVGIQTEGGGKGPAADGAQAACVSDILDLVAAKQDAGKTTDSPASQVLRVAVGMLGMELHEEPSSWAEFWLTFKDHTYSSLGLGSKRTLRKESELAQDVPVDWQMRVLTHLREQVNNREKAKAESDQPDDTDDVDDVDTCGHDWGPDFPEHLDLAEFALRKITYCVGVLEDPEKHDRPTTLREYTEEMVLKVAKDLRQWLHQLGTLVGVYHVHLLDLESERCRLMKLLEAEKDKLAAGEKERKLAVQSHIVLKERWDAEKMKRDAERLLGIKLAGEDAKIYSQRDVDEMFKQWEKEHLDPLLAELRELRLARDGLQDKLKKGKNDGGTSQSSAGVTLDKAAIAVLVGIIDAAAERVPDRLSKICSRWSADVAQGGHNLQEILADIRRLPTSDGDRGMSDGNVSRGLFEGGDGHPVVKCLETMYAEFNKLEADAKACPPQNGADKLGAFGAWARDSADAVKKSILSGGSSSVLSLPPPNWDLGLLSRKQFAGSGGGFSAGGANSGNADRSGDDDSIRASVEAEWQAKMDKLRRSLEAALREANERADREKCNADEALKRLEEEMAKADATMAELRRKIAMLEALLREKGLGKQAADAIFGAGLSEFMQGRDVFERLYRDALDRMKRLAESQRRYFEESSTDFLRSVGAIIDPNLKLPGLDPSFYSASEAGSPTMASRTGSPLPRGMPIGVEIAHEYSMPRSAGGSMSSSAGAAMRSNRSGSPSRSPSPSDSKSHGRGHKSAPYGPGVTSSNNRLRSAPAPASSPILLGRATTKVSRSELGGKAAGNHAAPAAPGFNRVSSQRPGSQQSHVQASEGLLTISSASPLPPGVAAGRRPNSQPSVSQFAWNAKPKAPRSAVGTGGSIGDKVLPRLECKGQASTDSRSQSPSHDESERRVSNLRGMRAGSPMREVRADRERLERVLGISKADIKESLLSIGSIRPTGGSMPSSGSFPGDARQERAERPSAKPAARPMQSNAGRMSRQGESSSMPHLGPPRLLVQSVGGAY